MQIALSQKIIGKKVVITSCKVILSSEALGVGRTARLYDTASSRVQFGLNVVMEYEGKQTVQVVASTEWGLIREQ